MSQVLPRNQAKRLGKLGNSGEPKDIEYWKLRGEDLFRALNTCASGLEASEAARRLREYGSNEIPSAGRRAAITMFMAQFKNPLVYALIFAGAVAGFLEV